MAWWTAASVIKGREYKSPYDWCQLNNHQGAIGAANGDCVAQRTEMNIPSRLSQIAGAKCVLEKGKLGLCCWES